MHLNDFNLLPVNSQYRALLEILAIFANSAGGAELKMIGAPANTGLLSLSQNLGNAKDHKITLIHQSITGFFEQEVDLLSEELS